LDLNTDFFNLKSDIINNIEYLFVQNNVQNFAICHWQVALLGDDHDSFAAPTAFKTMPDMTSGAN